MGEFRVVDTSLFGILGGKGKGNQLCPVSKGIFGQKKFAGFYLAFIFIE
jgi:hypothetical protein